MRLRTWVVLVVAAGVLAVAIVATLAMDADQGDGRSVRTTIDTGSACRNPRIDIDDVTWTTSDRVPDGRTGVVEGTLWITGRDALFIERDGSMSLRYTRVAADSPQARTCLAG